MWTVTSRLQSNLIQTLFCCLRARVLQACDLLKASTPPQTGAPVVDELTLEYLSQDCSSLRKQLLRLKMLLQVCTTTTTQT